MYLPLLLSRYKFLYSLIKKLITGTIQKINHAPFNIYIYKLHNTKMCTRKSYHRKVKMDWRTKNRVLVKRKLYLRVWVARSSEFCSENSPEHDLLDRLCRAAMCRRGFPAQTHIHIHPIHKQWLKISNQGQ